jgi:plasmid maintenance system killer protein
LSDWGRDHLVFEGSFLTRRRGGAEKHAESTFRGLASVRGASSRKVKKHSIRINDQWRICFSWHKGAAESVEIVDYH